MSDDIGARLAAQDYLIEILFAQVWSQHDGKEAFDSKTAIIDATTDEDVRVETQRILDKAEIRAAKLRDLQSQLREAESKIGRPR